MSRITDWLQLFRAQSAPLSVILTTIALLNGQQLIIDQHIDQHLLFLVIILVILMTFIHFLSYGQNSLNDTIMGYDTQDHYKDHHPLVNGKLSKTNVMIIIHVGLIIVTIIAALLTIYEGSNVVAGLFCLLLWYVLGNAYNGGLSKESLLNAPLFGLMFTAAVLWAYFLTHNTLTLFIIIYICFVFTLTYYQIAVEGNLIGIINYEPSNILIKIGSKVSKDETEFYDPHTNKHSNMLLYSVKLSEPAINFAMSAKFTNIVFTVGLLILTVEQFTNLVALNLLFSTSTCIIFLVIQIYLYDTLIQQQYSDFTAIRPKLLKLMSFDQVTTIYAIIPLVVGFWLALPIMLYGLLWFLLMNKYLWKTTYPDV